MYTIEWTQEIIVSRRYEDTVEGFVNKHLYHVKMYENSISLYVKGKMPNDSLELVTTYKGDNVKSIVEKYLPTETTDRYFEVPDIPENLKADLILFMKSLP
jgi:hypothetical protein